MERQVCKHLVFVTSLEKGKICAAILQNNICTKKKQCGSFLWNALCGEGGAAYV